MSAALNQLEHEATLLLEAVRLRKKLEEMSVPQAAKILKRSPLWVRRNLPLIIHSPKNHRVRLVDIEAYQGRRTLRPGLGRSSARDNGR